MTRDDWRAYALFCLGLMWGTAGLHWALILRGVP